MPNSDVDIEPCILVRVIDLDTLVDVVRYLLALRAYTDKYWNILELVDLSVADAARFVTEFRSQDQGGNFKEDPEKSGWFRCIGQADEIIRHFEAGFIGAPAPPSSLEPEDRPVQDDYRPTVGVVLVPPRNPPWSYKLK